MHVDKATIFPWAMDEQRKCQANGKRDRWKRINSGEIKLTDFRFGAAAIHSKHWSTETGPGYKILASPPEAHAYRPC